MVEMLSVIIINRKPVWSREYSLRAVRVPKSHWGHNTRSCAVKEGSGKRYAVRMDDLWHLGLSLFEEWILKFHFVDSDLIKAAANQ